MIDIKKNQKTSKLAVGDFVYKNKPLLHIIRSENSFLFTQEGHCLLDMESGNGAVALGYDYSILNNSILKLENLPNLPSFCESDLRINYSKKLASFIEASTKTPGKIAFELGGAQGIELALKIAKMNTKKSKVVVFEGAYHGRSHYTSYLSSSSRYRENNEYADSVIRLPYPDTISDNSFFTSESYIEYIDRMFSNEYSGIMSNNEESDICAFLFEPILNVGGLIKPELKVIHYLVKKAKSIGALVIIDEIFTGFYRTGKRFGFEHFNIKPDLFVSSRF